MFAETYYPSKQANSVHQRVRSMNNSRMVQLDRSSGLSPETTVHCRVRKSHRAPVHLLVHNRCQALNASKDYTFFLFCSLKGEFINILTIL